MKQKSVMNKLVAHHDNEKFGYPVARVFAS